MKVLTSNAIAQFGSMNADAVALNPQPLPPGDPSKRFASAALADNASLKSVAAAYPYRSDVLSKVALNPQPLPPGGGGDPYRSGVLSKVALNPQPLPPG